MPGTIDVEQRRRAVRLTVPVRALLAACALALLLPVAAPAAKPRLAVSSVGAPVGRAVSPDDTFVLRARVANRSRRARRVLLTFSLRANPRRRGVRAYPVGARNTFRIGPRRARRVRVRAFLPRGFPLRAGRPYWVTACVRRPRARRARCRTARDAIVFGRRRPGAPAPAPPPAPPPPQGGTIDYPTVAPGGPYTSGARTVGDRLFPNIGNGGYDVQHYDLEIQYQPVTDMFTGRTTITARATQNLSDFSLDFHGLTVSQVDVDGKATVFVREGDKLIVTPPSGIDSGTTFTTVVSYGGMIGPYTDPDDSHEGWVVSEDGAYVVNEPVGAMSWFPNNNVPTDKALYDMKVTVPATSTVFGNGKLVSNTMSGAQRTWHWREDSPMATYLTTATNGIFNRTTDVSDPDITYEYGFDPKVGPQPNLALSPDVVAFMEEMVGVPYPFTSSGGVVDAPPDEATLYALESQTRPMYVITAAEGTVVHEIVHMWYGDSVSPVTWSDIWLNEGPAVFYTWLWEGGTENSAEQFDANYEDEGFDWRVPPAAPPGPEDLFNTDGVYTRSGMVLEALRQIVGDANFFELQKAWLTEHHHGNASTADWMTMFKERSGADPAKLDVFFRQWLYTSYTEEGEKPDITPDNFATYTP